MKSTNAISVLAEHVAGTLPDSLTKRKAVLSALLEVMKESHPAYGAICNQLNAVESVQRLQAELPLHFQQEAK